MIFVHDRRQRSPTRWQATADSYRLLPVTAGYCQLLL